MQLSDTIYVFGSLKEKLTTQHPVKTVTSLSELPKKKGALIISCLPGKQQDELLREIHKSENGWCSKIFVKKESRKSPFLSDGLLKHELKKNKNPDTIWQYHCEKLALIKQKPADSLLGWLWLDKNRSLIPLLNSDHPTIYTYPLINLHHTEDETPYGYLASESGNHYLKKETFIDRIRQCPSCHSGHLNYTETCPDCHSHDIEEALSLHCFTCGHIAPQQEFQRNGALICPNCTTTLRHIGADYDRPLETLRCKSCGSDFAGPRSRTHCFTCGEKHDISALITRHLYTYKAGENCRNLMLSGHKAGNQILSLNGLVDTHYFTGTLSWMNQLALRYGQKHTLLALNICGAKGFTEKYGEAKLIQFVAHLSERLTSLHRDTDVSCQYRSNTLCVLLPMTEYSSEETIKAKITALSENLEYDDLSLQVGIWPLPDEALTEQPVIWLNDKLAIFDNE